MANLTHIIGGYVGGLGAGITGYAIDLGVSAMLEALRAFNPTVAALAVLYPIVSFFLGTKESAEAGVCFSFGIITTGALLNDGLTILSGIFSILAALIGLILKEKR